MTSKQVFTVAFLLISLPGISQVYNYFNPSAFNLETNPAVVANRKFDNRFVVSHQHSFSSTNPFDYSSFRYSKYLESSFVGLGVSINRTSYGEGIGYNHAGLALGYRNVLFNKLFLRLGAMYKLNQFNAPAGTFDYFQHTSMEASSRRGLRHNMNLSVMVGNGDNSRYISFSKLNVPLTGPSITEDFTIPTYYNWNVGNFLAFGGINPETKINYQGYVKKIGDTTTISHYLNFQVNKAISRKFSMNIGSRLGLTDEKYYHIAPTITIFSKNFAIQAYHNLHLLKENFQMPLPQSTQIRFTYKFY